MTGLPRERAPDPSGGGSGAPTGSSEDGPDWRDLAEATWLAAAWLASGRRAPGSSQRPEGDHPDDSAEPPVAPDSSGVPGSGLPPDSGPAGGSTAIPYAYAFQTPGPDLTSTETGGEPVFQLPPAPASPPAHPLRLARVLRALGRRVPTNAPGPLDEDATAQHGLSDGLWMPYLLPAYQRALDVVLLVDDTLTMRAWRGTVRRIADEAARSGAFRDVRTVRIRVPADGPAVVCTADGRAGDPRELLDGSGKRLFLVVTDGLGAGWAAPGADDLLTALARGGPTALVHLLPPYLRHRSSLYPFRAQFGAAGFGAANTALDCRPPHDVADPLRPLPEPDDGTVPVPVLSTHPASFTAWADLVTGEPGVHRALPMLPAGALAKGAPAPGLRTPRIDGPRAAAAAVARFAGLASPLARHLALLLAVIPLDFDLIEELRERAVPEAGPDHVAEVMMGGLIDWEHGHEGDGSGPEFADGVREALLATGTRTQLARIIDVLAELRRGRGATAPLRAAVRNPEDTPLPDTTTPGRPWLRIELAVLRALSGPHARRAARIVAGLSGGASLSNGGRTGVIRDGDGSGDGLDGEGLVAEITSEPGVPLASPAGTETTEHTEAGKADSTMDLKAPEHRFVRSGQPKIMGNVPPKNPNFTGREILLEAVDEQLRQKETAAVLPHALHGMGGVGKSQIAIEYVYRHSPEYNVIWWVPSERESLILASLAELASFLGLDTGPQANTAVPAVQEALRSGKPYDNWLLVFDNAEDIDAVRAYFPSGGPGKIIVTSRNRDWERVATPLSVDVFEREESIALLQRRAPDLATADADLLAGALGDLPLAIEQAGAWHAATGMPVTEHLELLAQRRVEILDLDPNPDYPVPVAAAWNLSLDRLAQEHPAARQLLEVCALMAPEPIPLSLLRGGRNVEVSPELDPVLRDPVLLARATRELSKFSLIRLDHKRGTLQMHRLMQSVLATGLDKTAEAQLRRAVHQLLATAKPGEGASPELWPAYQALLPHVQASGAVRSSDPWVRDLVYDVVFFLYYWGAHDTAMNMARQAWTIWQAQSGDDDIMVIRMAKILAFMLGKFGSRDEALRLSEKALDQSRTGEVPDEELVNSMSQMAFSQRYQGEFQAARALDDEALSMARRLFGPDDPVTLQAAHSFGVSLRWCGAFAEARSLDEETARQFDVLYGPTNGFTLNSLGGLAVDLRETGDYRSAHLLMESTYEAYLGNFGVDNASTIMAARELAVCRRRVGATAEARELIEDTFIRFTERYGTEYTDTLAAAMNVVVDRRITGELAQSRDLGEKVVLRYRNALGENHSATVSALVNLAATLRAIGDVGGAERCDVEAVERFTDTLGERHPNTLTARISRANDHYARLDFAAARAVDEAVLPLLDDVLGPDHPVTLTCTAHLALDLRGLGESAVADRLNAQAVEGFTRVLGADHPWRTAAQLHQRIECDIAPMPL
ncbi:FxSxx-COOH system tetratricopeptide repeat protein [Streptomyces sp. NPDC059639]|uniref:FxSxx-COOH system tetratricopeptide repeat protein n=1 Tax=Streptomyces sp. NPDC059639 TaxID=3346891 RepID=UPI0036B47D7F